MSLTLNAAEYPEYPEPLSLSQEILDVPWINRRTGLDLNLGSRPKGHFTSSGSLGPEQTHLKLLKESYTREHTGTIIGVIRGDTRSVDYGGVLHSSRLKSVNCYPQALF